MEITSPLSVLSPIVQRNVSKINYMYNMHMDMLNEDINFEWDYNKAFSNKLKHDVSFERATKNEESQYWKFRS